MDAALESYSASLRDGDRDNAVLDILTMGILFIMAVYITWDHSDTFHISAERVEIEASGRE